MPDCELQKVQQNKTGHPGNMSDGDGRDVGMTTQTRKNTGSWSAPLKNVYFKVQHQAMKYRLQAPPLGGF